MENIDTFFIRIVQHDDKTIKWEFKKMKLTSVDSCGNSESVTLDKILFRKKLTNNAAILRIIYNIFENIIWI